MICHDVEVLFTNLYMQPILSHFLCSISEESYISVCSKLSGNKSCNIKIKLYVKAMWRCSMGSKATPVTGRGGLQDCEMLIPHFLGNRVTDGGEIVSPMHKLRFTPQKDLLILISIRKNSITGTQTHDLTACSIVLQSSTLPRAPVLWQTSK
jgi:hypothetical protein